MGSAESTPSDTDGSGGASASTAAAPMSAAAATAAAWEWLDDGKKGWSLYDDTTARAIEAAYATGSGTATMTVGRTRYTIDPVSLTQTNGRTGFVRQVRRTPLTVPSGEAATTGQFVLWEWLNDGGWHLYGDGTAADLERLRSGSAASKVLPMRFGASDYELDAGTLKQRNKATGFVRQMRRRATAGVPVIASSAAAGGAGAGAGAGAAGGAGAGAGAGGDSSGPAPTEAQVKDMTGWTVIAADNREAAELKEQDCPICICPLADDDDDDDAHTGGGGGSGAEAPKPGIDDGSGTPVVRLGRCKGHWFHATCIVASFAHSNKCPMCGEIYGAMKGDQPDGTFTSRTQRSSLPGYSGCGTIVINYNFPSGTQGPMHPNPGKPYHGTSRVGYLPDNAEGREVLRLLKLSFDRRLTFTVGTSITTGRSDCVIWNGVHHKTSTSGGPSGFGYPDPDYLERVTEELALKGVK